ncbi:D-alanyl-lipoteichoic acid biosynthesis protein DltB [uncultured Clostridium sp.]|uniref:D-alanyl-lipoteichoic acid biosynthesis protein DltB n=1 Tax=uncultured Clostridium sp. TaxID=59620 RepID=UPI0025E4FAB3|nr:D-alanyl-lipoteichoic acid biosynthesis protein DltB [uncultured Clostridium sp.]
MSLEQYGSYFYLYILMLMLIPAVILGIREKLIRPYGIIFSAVMIIIIMGWKLDTVFSYLAKGDFRSALKCSQIEIILFILFLLGETLLIKVYFHIRKCSENKYIYFTALILCMLPVIILKISPLTDIGAVGFIGLSYINFKAIQMIIEIYDGSISELNIIDLIYFIIFVPTLSCGPIDRFRRFTKDSKMKISRQEYIHSYIFNGMEHILKGILYKFCIAALISTLWMDKIPDEITFHNSVSYMYAYSMYLFFDFAGYSAFAIGTSYFLGIRTPENFNLPFLSKSMKEFWNRWHISLSKWFGDYIYSRFVLNSMRKKMFKNRIHASHAAQIITMLVMGLWHGITPYYIIYGLYQGIALVLTDIYERKSKFYKNYKKEKWFQCVQVIVTFNVVCFGLLIFSGYLFTK